MRQNRRRIGRIAGIGLLIGAVSIAGCMLFEPKVSVDIAVSDTEGATPMVVEFAAVVAGDVASYYWDFGDGETSIESSPVHVYRAAGTYDVFLSVTLADGSNGSVEKEGLIDVALITQKATLTDLYWLNANTGTIHRGDRAGYAEETIVSYIYRGRDLAVGVGYVFWAADETIYRSNYDGSDKKAIVTGQQGLASVTVNAIAYAIYWSCLPSMPFSSNYWAGSLKTANLVGSLRKTLEEYDDSARPYIWYVRSDVNGMALYRYFDDDNYVRPVRLTPNAADDGKLQYMVFPSPTTHSIGTVKTSMNGITAMALDVSDSLARHIYWIAGGAIRRCRVDGSDATTILRGLNNPKGVAADIVEGKMYWSDAKGIHRADLDGTNDELIYPGVRADVLVIQQ